MERLKLLYALLCLKWTCSVSLKPALAGDLLDTEQVQKKKKRWDSAPSFALAPSYPCDCTHHI